MPVPSCDQRNAVPNENGNDADDELIDSVQRGDQSAAAHDPNVLAICFLEPPHERADRLADELDRRRNSGWRGASGEDDIARLRIELRADRFQTFAIRGCEGGDGKRLSGTGLGGKRDAYGIEITG